MLLRLLWRGLRTPAYWQRWGERFGYFPHSVDSPPVWIHAVSVGEAQAAIPLVNALREQHPQWPIVLTTTTPTGSQRIREVFGDTVLHAYICYDAPGMVKRFLARVQPRVAIMLERELWPNLFHYCVRSGTPVIIANARLSPHSTIRYHRITRLTRETLGNVAAVAAQSETDAERLIQLGLDPARVCVTGSIKFDVRLPESLREQAAVMRRDWGVNRSVWIAASTHEGEEELILKAFEQVRRSVPNALLVLVPRHPERFTKAAAMCRKHGHDVVLRSEHQPCDAHTSVFIGDTMGELVVFYAASDVAFVGGTMVMVGGHNILEPAALGLPVITGPYLHNFEEISQKLLASDAARQVNDEHQLAETVIALLNDADLRYSMGQQGRQVVEENRGALQSLLDIIEAHAAPDARQQGEKMEMRKAG